MYGPNNPSWTTGRYAHVFKRELAAHLGAIQADGADPLDLVPELEVQRVLLASFLDHLQGGSFAAGAELMQGAAIAGAAGDGEGGEEGGVIDGVGPVACGDDGGKLVQVDVSYGGVCPDSSLGPPVSHPRSQFFKITAGELEQLRLLTNDIVGTVTRIIAARNQTALTKAEIVWMMGTLREGIGLFVEPDKQRAFVAWLKERIPVKEKGEASVE